MSFCRNGTKIPTMSVRLLTFAPRSGRRLLPRARRRGSCEPLRGEVDFGLTGKTRSALVVLGAFGDRDRPLIMVVPHTTSLHASPSNHRTGAPSSRAGGLPDAEGHDHSDAEQRMLAPRAQTENMNARMPAIFFGHGNPMNALLENSYTQGWRSLGASLPRPRSVLCISAHWYVPQTGITVTTAPRTIHDFGGFPRELYQVNYPAPGDPDLARRVQKMLAPVPVTLDGSWGLDHGTWSVLTHVFPKADVPVVQTEHRRNSTRVVSLRYRPAPGAAARRRRAHRWQRQPGAQPPYVRLGPPRDGAVRFEEKAREMILAGEHQPLVAYEKLGRDALLSIPTPDHYLPLLYVLATRQPDDPISFPIEGVDGGSISMLTVRVG